MIITSPICAAARLQDLLPRLTPILKNRHEKVQDQFSALASIYIYIYVYHGVLLSKGGILLTLVYLSWQENCIDLVGRRVATFRSYTGCAM